MTWLLSTEQYRVRNSLWVSYTTTLFYPNLGVGVCKEQFQKKKGAGAVDTACLVLQMPPRQQPGPMAGGQGNLHAWPPQLTARYNLSDRSFHHVMDIFSKFGKKKTFQMSKNFLNWKI